MTSEPASSPYRSPHVERVEYRVVCGSDPGVLSATLTDLAAQGYRVIPGAINGAAEYSSIFFLLHRTVTE